MARKILGIDPGLRITGYAVLLNKKSGIEILDAGVLRTKTEGSFESRLLELYDSLEEVIKEHKPDSMSVEKLYSHYNHPQTAVVMGHARGAIFLCAAKHGVPVESYASTRIKKSLTGNGRASKLQMQRTVKSIFGMKEIPKPPDVADAIAAALCHLEAER